jgi:hypothetical protein
MESRRLRRFNLLRAKRALDSGIGSYRLQGHNGTLVNN